MRKTSLLLLITLFTSCSFNKIFLKPTPISRQARKARTIDLDTHDTTYVRFSGNNFQPEFVNKNNEITEKEYIVESVLFKNSNGTELNGWFLTPKSGTPEITILHLHGNEGNLLTQYKAVAPLVKNGFQIFLFDYSGFGFSEGKATQQNILVDALSAVDFVKSRLETKQTKLVIYGQSAGGHLASVVAEKKKSLIDGLIIEGAFSSPKDIAAYTLKKKIGLGFIGRALTKSDYDALTSIKKFQKPVLIIHSKEDKEVPFYMSQKLYNHANNPKQFYPITGPHIYGPKLFTDSISLKIKALIK